MRWYANGRAGSLSYCSSTISCAYCAHMHKEILQRQRSQRPQSAPRATRRNPTLAQALARRKRKVAALVQQLKPPERRPRLLYRNSGTSESQSICLFCLFDGAFDSWAGKNVDLILSICAAGVVFVIISMVAMVWFLKWRHKKAREQTESGAAAETGECGRYSNLYVALIR